MSDLNGDGRGLESNINRLVRSSCSRRSRDPELMNFPVVSNMERISAVALLFIMKFLMAHCSTAS